MELTRGYNFKPNNMFLSNFRNLKEQNKEFFKTKLKRAEESLKNQNFLK